MYPSTCVGAAYYQFFVRHRTLNTWCSLEARVLAAVVLLKIAAHQKTSCGFRKSHGLAAWYLDRQLPL